MVDWIDVGSYDIYDGSAHYLFSYFIFNCYASTEEKRELAQIRRENDGDNQLALSSMYARLKSRRYQRTLKEEQDKRFRNNLLYDLEHMPYKKEYKEEHSRWSQREKTPVEMDQRRTYKGKLTQKELIEAFDEPILETVRVDKYITMEFHDKVYGCYTIVFNTPMKQGYNRDYRRTQHLENFELLNKIYIKNLKDVVASYIKRINNQRPKMNMDGVKEILKEKEEYMGMYRYPDISFPSSSSSRRSSSSNNSSPSNDNIVNYVREALGQRQQQETFTDLFSEEIF